MIQVKCSMARETTRKFLEKMNRIKEANGQSLRTGQTHLNWPSSLLGEREYGLRWQAQRDTAFGARWGNNKYAGQNIFHALMQFSFSALFSAKVKHHKSPANRAKIGGRVHFDFPKENRVKRTVRL